MSGILLIENIWYGDISDTRDSVKSLFPAIRQSLENTKIKTASLVCGTKAELTFRLQKSRVRNYNVLVLAFHGDAGKINTEQAMPIELEELADIMKDKYSGFAIHFGACKTFTAELSRIRDFKKRVGARAVSGYNVNSGWNEDYLALEMVLLCAYLRGKKSMDVKYSKLAKSNGLVII